MQKLFKLSDMQNLHQGRPAAVLGGGPSLPTDMEHLPSDCVLIACNYHAREFCFPDYMVYNDNPLTDPALLEAVQRTGAVRVSQDPSSDVTFDVRVWTNIYSSCTATWFGLWLGCNPVILCGMDMYQGPVKYCHAMDRDEEAWHYPLDFHLRPWIEECRNLVPHPERIRIMSGPLTSLFGAYLA